jgi:hypothetical protein
VMEREIQSWVELYFHENIDFFGLYVDYCENQRPFREMLTHFGSNGGKCGGGVFVKSQ